MNARVAAAPIALALLLAASPAKAWKDMYTGKVVNPSKTIEEEAAELKPVVYFNDDGKAQHLDGVQLLGLSPGMIETVAVSLWETPIKLGRVSQPLADEWKKDNLPRIDAMIALLQKAERPLPNTASGADLEALAAQVKSVQASNKPYEAKKKALEDAKDKIAHYGDTRGLSFGYR